MQQQSAYSISKSALVYGSLTHSSLFFSEAFCVSFRPHCMCLTRLGLLFPTSQPEHSKNTHTHTQSNTLMLQAKAVTLSHMGKNPYSTFSWWWWHTLYSCVHTCRCERSAECYCSSEAISNTRDGQWCEAQDRRKTIASDTHASNHYNRAFRGNEFRTHKYTHLSCVVSL